jgi:peptidoglycan hydrolase-like protein with peptidoglycan-binding domain
MVPAEPKLSVSLSLIRHNSAIDGLAREVRSRAFSRGGNVPQRSPARHSRHEEDEAPIDGLVARVAERVFENPAMSGGLFVMALTATAIISNAMLLQSTRHPQPLFTTRPEPVAASDEVPIPRPRADQVGAIGPVAIEPPAPRSPPPELTRPAPPAAEPDLLAALQKALADRGLYSGTIDGIIGSRTRTAITAYQKAVGLPVTGEPSAALLDHMRVASLPPSLPEVATISEQPPVVVAAPTAEPPTPAERTIESVLETPPTVAPAEPIAALPIAAEPASPVERVVAKVEPPPSQTLAPSVEERNRNLAVQRALNQIGYGPLIEDGALDAGTGDAIRRFELDNGLPLTGTAGDRVVSRLVSIGAMNPI